MKRFCRWRTHFALALIGLAAGCFVDPGGELQRSSTAASAGRSPAGASWGGSGVVGPPAAASAAPDEDSVSRSADGTATVSGTGTGSAPRDGLSGRFPDCGEPAQGMFWRSEVLRLVNDERRAAGVAALVRSETLEAQAEQYACELIHYDFFDHVNPQTGSRLRDRAAEFGYQYFVIGENLAAGQSSPAQAVDAWMKSPCHRENILNPAFIEVGIGVRVGGEYGYYWVQEFGRPTAAGPYAGPPHHDPDCQN